METIAGLSLENAENDNREVMRGIAEDATTIAQLRHIPTSLTYELAREVWGLWWKQHESNHHWNVK